jgi:two-component system, sensor histidine kinase LadS
VTILRLCLVLLLLAGLIRPGHATGPGVPEGAALAGQVLIDPQGLLGPDDVVPLFLSGQSQVYSPTNFYPTQGATAVWFWLEVPAPALREPSVLMIPYPGLNSLRLYEHEAGSTAWREQRAGDDIPVSAWAIPHLFPAMPMASGGEPMRHVLLRVQNSHPVTFPWRIEPRAAFEARHQRLVLLLGMYLGLVALVVVLSAVNAFTLREPVYAVYALYVILLALTQSSLTGVSGLFFWPDHAAWNDLSVTVLPLLSLAAAAWFVRAIVSPVPWRWLGWLLWIYAAAGLVLATLFVLLGRDPVFRPANYYFLLGIPLCLGALVWYARTRSVHGWWLVGGLSAMYAGAIFTAMRNLGVMPMNGLTQYGAQIGAAIEIPLLMIGLYLRSRDRRDALVRRAALQTRDPVTGLANDRLTRDRVDHVVHRLSMHPGRACVMRVRVGNLKEILAAHGIQVMAGATLHAASCLALITREGDTVGRLKNGDFVLILERTLSAGLAMQEAARVVARGLAYSQRMPAGLTIRFYIALSLSAHESGDAETLLTDLEVILDDIAESPQRVIRIAPSVNAPASRAERPVPG